MIRTSELGRVFWPLLGSLALWGLSAHTATAEVRRAPTGEKRPVGTRMQTYTYKQVGDLEIKADVYRADDETIRPVVWIHGGAFYQFCQQRGIWPQEVSGWNPHTEGQKYHPYMPVKNVTTKFPPTFLVHDTRDTDVLYEQSVLMADQFGKFGVDHVFVTIQDGEHGLAGGDPKEIDQAYQQAFRFVHRRMAGK